MIAQLHGQTAKSLPVRVAIIGLTHTHVHWILGRPDRGDITIVGIVEPNRDLAQRYSKQHGFSMKIVFATMEEMIASTKPEAVTAFGTIFDHLKIVETFAPLGIHVMVEKPLAVSLDHALRMKALAKKYKIHLLTNYETSWYSTNHKIHEMVNRGAVGPLRKIVVHDGHKGPIELGINQEFLEWLTDPVKNGAGALTDFGCYGANLITWLKNGERPEEVTAVTQTLKPELYPNVDDEATIILKYPNTQGLIQASWNWPIARKDMEVYGTTGYILSDNRSDLRYRLSENEQEQKEKLQERISPFDDPFALLAAVVQKNVVLPPFDVSSLENNMIVMEILEAAKTSAATGKTIRLKK
ncbi:MAG: Gfo/Idh/MocA family oxidoreductase [Bacteroidetes bacterium]|nr:Gfo/Idh/MocA family oxidoreductase [Bacteroidota bacterium]